MPQSLAASVKTERLYFLRALRKINLSQHLLLSFYHCCVESILVFIVVLKLIGRPWKESTDLQRKFSLHLPCRRKRTLYRKDKGVWFKKIYLFSGLGQNHIISEQEESSQQSAQAPLRNLPSKTSTRKLAKVGSSLTPLYITKQLFLL